MHPILSYKRSMRLCGQDLQSNVRRETTYIMSDEFNVDTQPSDHWSFAQLVICSVNPHKTDLANGDWLRLGYHDTYFSQGENIFKVWEVRSTVPCYAFLCGEVTKLSLKLNINYVIWHFVDVKGFSVMRNYRLVDRPYMKANKLDSLLIMGQLGRGVIFKQSAKFHA